MEPIKPIKRPLNPAYSRLRSVDGMMRRPGATPQPRVMAQPLPVQPAPVHAPAAAPQPIQLTKPPQKKSSWWLSALQMGAVIVLGIGAGLVFQFLPLGQVAVIIYGVIAVARRIPSFVTFIVLMVAIAALAVFSALGNFGVIAQNVAMYVFFLFIFGLASAALELKRASKQTSINPQQGVAYRAALSTHQ